MTSTSRFARKRRSNEENEGPKELKPSRLKRWREEASTVTQVSGRVKCIELENFMCHEKLRVEFDLTNNNCFYIGGPNGSGKSALFAAMNIGLGGRGNHNDRGSSVKNYIKEGRRTAKIRITLTNVGQSSHPSYGEYSIVERTINQSGSNYVLKSVDDGKETKVSTRKGDLDKLVNRYGIQLINPIFWMSQDRSRHFLQQMKPDKLYEIFMYATELDSTREFYKKLDQVVIDVTSVIASFERSFAEKKKEIKKMAEHRQNMAGIDKKRYELTVMGWYRLWFPLRDVLVELEALVRRKEVVTNSISELKERAEQNREERKGMNEEVETLNDELGRMGEKSEIEMKALHEAQGKQKEVESEIRGINESIGDLKNKERSDEKQIKEIELEIRKREDALLSNGKANEKMLMERKVRELDDQRAGLEEEVRKTKELFERNKENYRAKESAVERMKSEKYDSDKKMKNAIEDLHESNAVAKDKLARFGRDIPHIVQEIKKNLSKFEKEPLGPIGQYLNVREEQWTLAIEKALRQNMCSFVLHSQKDRKLFFDLCRRLGVQCPNVIVTNFNVPAHDTRRNEPDMKIPTVERMLQFSNTTIRNCLIDVVSIESLMLIETDEEAREILDGRCPVNVRKAFTRSGGDGMGRNAQGGSYRFYPNIERNARANFLIKNKTYDVKELNYIVSEEKKKSGELGEIIRKDEAVLKQLNMDKAQLIKKGNELEQKKNFKIGEKNKLERQLRDMVDEEEEDNTIANLKTTIDEFRVNIKKINNEKEGLQKTREKMNTRLSIAKSSVADAKKKLEKASEGSGPIEKRLAALKADIDRIDASHENFIANKKKLTVEEDGFHDKFVAVDRKKEEAEEMAELRKSPQFLARFASTGGKPAEFSDPPDFSEMPATDEMQKTYDDLDMEVNAAMAAMDAVSYDENVYRKMVEEFNTHKKSFKRLKAVGRELRNCQTERNEKLPILRHAVTIRLKLAFQKLMSMSNYCGELRVRTKEKVIEIKVLTHGEEKLVMDDDDERGRNVAQDLKGLSGGERSYTTACFIMSLWEIMEAPFRCMDEFDVFMDMVNRKIVMELLVKLATEEFAHSQFIFFTPQGIRELGARDKVQIFEMPKVRD